MGIFKRKRNFDIELKQDISGYLVFPFQLKKDIVQLNYKAIVPENKLLAFATRGKVLDYLQTGEHVIHPVTLPNCNKKHHLQKTDKHGALPTGFYGYVYYINQDEVKNLSFGTYKKLRYANKTDGKFWVKMQFAIDLKILDTDKFMKSLLKQLAYLRIGECEDIVEGWISEFVTDSLQKTQYQKSQLEKSQIYGLVGEVAQNLSKMLGNVGLGLCDMRILEVELPKKSSTKTKNPLLESVEDESYSLINQQPSQKFVKNQQEQFEENVDNYTSQRNDETQTEQKQKWQGWEQFLGKK